jgi:hypothetical protein
VLINVDHPKQRLINLPHFLFSTRQSNPRHPGFNTSNSRRTHSQCLRKKLLQRWTLPWKTTRPPPNLHLEPDLLRPSQEPTPRERSLDLQFQELKRAQRPGEPARRFRNLSRIRNTSMERSSWHDSRDIPHGVSCVGRVRSSVC